MLVHMVIPTTITAKPTKRYKIYMTMVVLRNRCDLIGATHIPVVPRLIYENSPDPILLGSGAARLALNKFTKSGQVWAQWYYLL